jgi:hypothetical protein
MEAVMATPDTADMGRIEHEIARVRDDLGRTVAEIGARLTPAHLMEQAKQGLRDTTVGTTRAVAESAAGLATDVASRTRDAALGARDQAQAHPYVVGAMGAGIGFGYWLVASAKRNRRRLIPREWDEPFDRSNRRRLSNGSTIGHALPIAAGVAAAIVLWRARA